MYNGIFAKNIVLVMRSSKSLLRMEKRQPFLVLIINGNSFFYKLLDMLLMFEMLIMLGAGESLGKTQATLVKK